MIEVAVIGAGPAGSAIAGRLAAGGYETALIGSLVPQRHGPHRFSHTIGPSALRSTTACGVDVHDLSRWTRPILKINSAWGDADRKTAIVRCQPALASVARPTLDHLLRTAAKRAGSVMLDDEVIRLDRAAGGRGWVVDLRGGRSLQARVIVDAAGRGARFARRYGARLRVIDRLVCWCTVLTGSPDAPDATLEIDTAPDGWIYSAAAGPNERQLAYFGDGDATCMSTERPGIPRHFYDAPILERFRHRLHAATIMKMTAVTAYLDQAMLDGLVAVGDAAQTYDPLSSQGIAFAIDDALSAGDAIARTFQGNSRALHEHEKKRREAFATFMLERQAYYRSSNRRHALFWDRRRTFSKLDTTRSRPHG